MSLFTSKLIAPSVEGDNTKAVSGERGSCTRQFSSNHYFDITESQTDSSLPSSLLIDNEPRTLSGELSHRPGFGVRNNYPRRKTRFQEYKLPPGLGTNREFQSNSKPMNEPQSSYSVANYVHYDNPYEKDEKLSGSYQVEQKYKQGDSRSDLAINFESASFQEQDTKLSCHPVVDLEYYDINTDHELNTMTSRRTKSLTGDGALIECFPVQVGGSANNDATCRPRGANCRDEPEKRRITACQGEEKQIAVAISRSQLIDQVTPAERNCDNLSSRQNRLSMDGIKRHRYFEERESKVGTTNGNLDSVGYGCGKNNFLNNNDYFSNMPSGKFASGANGVECNLAGVGNNYRANNKQPIAMKKFQEKTREFGQSSSGPGATQLHYLSASGRFHKSHGDIGSIPVQVMNYNHDPSIAHVYSSQSQENNLCRTTPRTRALGKSSFQPNVVYERDAKSNSCDNINLELHVCMAKEGQRFASNSTPSIFAADVYDADGDNYNRVDIPAREEFKATLKQLSRYVLTGYKENVKKPPRDARSREKNELTRKMKHYHLDEEGGELAEVKQEFDDFKRLSMIVNVISRLRELYTIVPSPTSPYHGIEHGHHESHYLEDSKDNDILREAIENRPMSEVKSIINRLNVDINLRSKSGLSSLHRAALEGDIDGVRILIEHDADLNADDRYGYPPVHYALQHCHYKAAMFLMDCGTDLMSYTSTRIQEFVKVKATAKQYLWQNLKTSL